MTGYRSSSQESLLLSEESYSYLYNQLDGIPLNDVDSVNNSANQEFPVMEQVSNLYTAPLINQPLISSENLLTNIPQEQQKVPSSLPATESWPGEFQFNVTFRFDQAEKKNACIYVDERNKLYVRKDTACPINFSTNTLMTDVIIRVMALFSSAEHTLEKVHRCINHAMQDIQNNLPEAEHLVRCESRHAIYCNQSGRHSVIVPFENPAAGQQSSCYIYKFACFGSCSGGPNRRPLLLVFTLEKGGYVIGRQKVDLKICACPSRDAKTDEIDFAKSKPAKRVNCDVADTAVSKRTKFENGLTPGTTESTPNNHCSKYIKKKKPKQKKYCIEIEDLEGLNFLRFCKTYYDIHKYQSRLPLFQSLRDFVRSLSSSEDDENKGEN